MTLFTILTLIFTVLKLTGYITWSWFYVLLPSIIHGVLFFLAIFLAVKYPLFFFRK